MSSNKKRNIEQISTEEDGMLEYDIGINQHLEYDEGLSEPENSDIKQQEDEENGKNKTQGNKPNHKAHKISTGRKIDNEFKKLDEQLDKMNLKLPKTNLKSMYVPSKIATDKDAFMKKLKERTELQTTDTRPIKEMSYQQRCLGRVYTYLKNNGFSAPISRKQLATPTRHLFESIMVFLIQKLEPGFKFGQKVIDDIIPALEYINYPFIEDIQKSMLIAVASSTSWPTLLAMLDWMIVAIKAVEKAKNVDALEEVMENPETKFKALSFKLFSEKYAECMQNGFGPNHEMKIKETINNYFNDDIKEMIEYNEKLLKIEEGLDAEYIVIHNDRADYLDTLSRHNSLYHSQSITEEWIDEINENIRREIARGKLENKWIMENEKEIIEMAKAQKFLKEKFATQNMTKEEALDLSQKMRDAQTDYNDKKIILSKLLSSNDELQAKFDNNNSEIYALTDGFDKMLQELKNTSSDEFDLGDSEFFINARSMAELNDIKNYDFKGKFEGHYKIQKNLIEDRIRKLNEEKEAYKDYSRRLRKDDTKAKETYEALKKRTDEVEDRIKEQEEDFDKTIERLTEEIEMKEKKIEELENYGKEELSLLKNQIIFIEENYKKLEILSKDKLKQIEDEIKERAKLFNKFKQMNDSNLKETVSSSQFYDNEVLKIINAPFDKDLEVSDYDCDDEEEINKLIDELAKNNASKQQESHYNNESNVNVNGTKTTVNGSKMEEEGKVHGSLARAGKVKSQCPKVEKQEKPKKLTGRAKKRAIYLRRFVNVTNANGKRRMNPAPTSGP